MNGKGYGKKRNVPGETGEDHNKSVRIAGLRGLNLKPSEYD
jgi:hypothetical protein